MAPRTQASRDLAEPLLDPASEEVADGESPAPADEYPRAAILTLGLITLCDAVEYGVVMPSLYPYLLTVAGDSMTTAEIRGHYGLALSVFSAASFVVKPFLGAATDRFSYKAVYSISIVIAVVGNLLYSSAAHFEQLWMIPAGRAMAGVGCANTALGFSYVARVVPQRRRTAIMTGLGMAFPIGLVLGPACNLITANANFTVHGFVVNANNSPGVFVSTILVVLLGFILAFVTEPPTYGAEHRQVGNGICGVLKDVFLEIRKPAVLKSFATIFFFNLFITASESIVVPVTRHAFGFTTFQNSLVYMGIAVEVIVLSMVVMAASSKVPDDVFVLSACVCGAVGVGFVLALWSYAMPLWHFLVGEAVMLTAIPLALSPNRARFSKIVSSSRLQGLLNALLGSVASIAGIVGPMYASILIGEPTKDGPVGRMLFIGVLGMGTCLFAWELGALLGKARARKAEGADADPAGT